MVQFINYYSFALLALLLWVVVAVFLLRKQPGPQEVAAVAALALVLFLIWLGVRPRQTVLSAEASTVQMQVGQGTPVMIEFQSPYCMACTLIKPTVDRLEAELAGQLVILRVNMQSPAGRDLANYYGANYTPTFVFFDAAGQELWRQVGTLDETRVRLSVEP